MKQFSIKFACLIVLIDVDIVDGKNPMIFTALFILETRKPNEEEGERKEKKEVN
jgi:hypothetical protein